ncbi:MAG: hypothetical protein QY331_02545 [Melioribacteraceae bacterium]|jgi:hypothetical protein|nr:hypothetical protein [Melioribacteraceae bacterium]RJP63146.1 MAG: hypothetical protein C4543_00920 [Ignavibacteriales bacterium]WKZ70134.1 MAG: hypothetical protein QY331_02545 [Melioribacteraceae bacterium]
MLKSIANIKSSSGAENSGKNIYRKFMSSTILKHEDVHDSLNISQGYRIFRDYNFDLKRFRKNNTGLLEIIFDYSEIKFETLLNIENLTNFLRLDYELRFKEDNPQFAASVFTRTYYSEFIENQLRINNISFLMDRINTLGVGSEINISNTRALSNLLDGAYNGILNEFKTINSILITAAKNTFNLGIKHLPKNDAENELVLIQKITPLNGNY